MLMPFLSSEWEEILNQLLEALENDDNTTKFILTSVAFTIIEARFAAYRGEYELV